MKANWLKLNITSKFFDLMLLHNFQQSQIPFIKGSGDILQKAMTFFEVVQNMKINQSCYWKQLEGPNWLHFEKLGSRTR